VKPTLHVTDFPSSFASSPLIGGPRLAKEAHSSLRDSAQGVALSPGKLRAAGFGGMVLETSGLFPTKTSLPGLQRSLISRGQAVCRR
jgi:hypothetical protein